MRTFAYLCALVLLAPQLAFDAAFLSLDRVTSGHTLGALLSNALDFVSLLFGWGGVVALAAIVGAIVAAFHRHSRGVAAIVVALAGVGTAVDLLRRIGVPASIDVVLFFVPGALGIALCVWVAWRELAPARAA